MKVVFKIYNAKVKHNIDQSTPYELPLQLPFLTLRHKHKKREFG